MRDALDADCAPDSLAALDDAPPSAVRNAVLLVHSERADPPTGVSHNHPLSVPLTVPLLGEWTWRASMAGEPFV